MFDLTLQVAVAYSLAALDTAMRAQFGERISGVSGAGDLVRVHFYEAYTAADEVAAQAIVDNADHLVASRPYSGTITDDEWLIGLTDNWD